MLTNRYLIALGIPLLLMLCSALAKKIVRGSGWKVSDSFLGVEVTLSALGSAMVYFYDLQQTANNLAGREQLNGNKIAATATFLVISFFLLLFILSTHQDWEGRIQNPKGQIIRLGIICNAIGISLFATFIIIVKGI